MIRKLLLGAIVAVGVVALATAAYAAVINVPADQPTIQAAIGAANPAGGDIIQVAAGLYDENLDINVKVSIEGAGSGTNSSVDTIIDPSGGSYGMYIHQPVNLKDLRVTGAPSHGIRVEPLSGRLDFSNVTWENIASSANGQRGVEIHNDTDVSNMVIKNCEFVNNGNQGLRTASNVTVDGMGITDSDFSGNSYGIYLQGTINGVTILRSDFNNSTSDYGGYMTETGRLTNLVIEDSEFNNNVVGLMVWNVQDNEGITITGTSFQDNDKWGVLIWGNTLTDVLIQSSSVLNNDRLDIGYYGIDFNTYDEVMTNVAVHYTNITGHSAGGGVKNRNDVATAIVDATYNWWGDVSGPYHPTSWLYDTVEITNPDGIGDEVSDYVLYDPWIGQAGMVTGGGWIDSPAGAMSMPASLTLTGPLTAEIWGGGNYTRDLNALCSPNDTPITFSGWVDLSDLSANGALLLGLLDKKWIDDSNTGFFSGAYAYFGRMLDKGTGKWTKLRIGPSDGNAGGGELNQVGANVIFDPWETVRVNFTMEIFNGDITVTYEATDYVDNYGDIPPAMTWDEFAFGAYAGVDYWDGTLGKSVDYQVTINGCEVAPTGKATFGFVAKNKKTQTPDGSTEFMFKAGDLNFHSNDYKWLVVNKAASRAQFKGQGTINGEGAYKFMLWATDGDPDTFRIKIWWEEDDIEHVVYDNGFDGSGYETGQPIEGGNIVVHKK